MHKSHLIVYVFILVIFAVEKSDSKQGAACLSYGHSCWGAHGKRNVDMLNNPNAWFLQRMAMIQKQANKDSPMDQNRLQDEDISKYFNIFKTYMLRNSKKPISDDIMENWDIEPSKFIPKGRYYGDTQVLDPRME